VTHHKQGQALVFEDEQGVGWRPAAGCHLARLISGICEHSHIVTTNRH
jgi:hypothetical protein